MPQDGGDKQIFENKVQANICPSGEQVPLAGDAAHLRATCIACESKWSSSDALCVWESFEWHPPSPAQGSRFLLCCSHCTPAQFFSRKACFLWVLFLYPPALFSCANATFYLQDRCTLFFTAGLRSDHPIESRHQSCVCSFIKVNLKSVFSMGYFFQLGYGNSWPWSQAPSAWAVLCGDSLPLVLGSVLPWGH